jgi:hypothetical protein
LDIDLWLQMVQMAQEWRVMFLRDLKRRSHLVHLWVGALWILRWDENRCFVSRMMLQCWQVKDCCCCGCVGFFLFLTFFFGPSFLNDLGSSSSSSSVGFLFSFLAGSFLITIHDVKLMSGGS